MCFRCRDDDGREGGDTEEHVTARMRWLWQKDHGEVSSHFTLHVSLLG